ncbi:methyltransferase domain-containing protein [Nonlabens sp. Ci31]|jgi:thiopurine S-methyltransferase|uniref:methyltransferase domain-containing protein n=1 Tax=Nonlabens sp. Ci31 TaxID=2608253 RepID=UPI00146437E0|nr:methyltransferase domain-containing protein [Nonlabens sp. Ci31]QJP34614.1 methyltransferase domain-containing protein [Nonlabens sp. Ci31]
MKHDQNYWQERYVEHTTGWDLGQASKPLKSIVDKIEDKELRILIPGAGNAYEAEYLIKNGFSNVTVLDIAWKPLLQLKERLKNTEDIAIIQGDFLKHKGNYDLILEQTFFCALESRFRESYINKCHELLKKNGCIEGVLFDFDSKTKEPPYPATKKEYLNLFQKKFEIINLDRCLISEEARQGKELIIKMKKND